MGRRVFIWAVTIIPIVLSLFILYLLYFAAIQEKCAENLQYVVNNEGSHIYWNKFKFPTITGLSHHFISDVIANKDEQAQLLHEIDPNNRENEGLKTKLIGAAEDSLEKTKMMMEDTAKSAAEMAGEVVHKTADIVKESLSKHTLASQSHDEL